jgi:hypothetical protein
MLRTALLRCQWGAAQPVSAGFQEGVIEVMQAGGWKSPAMVGRSTTSQGARRGVMAMPAAKQTKH